jgi:hypothetical protein
MSKHEELPTIDAAALEAVTGGATSSDAQLTAALQGIKSSLSSIGNTNNSGNALTQMLPFLLMARGGGGSSAPATAAAAGACPCGCGMANCLR